MKAQIAQSVGIVVAFLVVAAVLLWAVGTRFQVAPSIADTDGRSYATCGSFTDFQGWGQFPSPGGRAEGEVFTHSTIYFAWTQDGFSQDVTVAARVLACNDILGFPSPPDRVYYRFDYSEDGRTWIGFKQDYVPAGVYAGAFSLGAFDKDVPLLSYSFGIDGFEFEECTFHDNTRYDSHFGSIGWDIACDPTGKKHAILDGAALRVLVLVARVAGPLGDVFDNYEPVLIFQDQVALRSALPEVGWRKGAYRTGETALLDVHVPTATYEDCDASGGCTSRPAYYLSVLDLNPPGSALTGYDRVAVEARDHTYSIPITADLFSNDLATCTNRLRAILYSPLIVSDQADTAVQNDTLISVQGKAPSVTKVTFDKPEYVEGESVTIRWTWTGNVTKFHVTAHIGGLPLDDKDYDAPTNTTTFSAARTGILEVEVTPYDRCNTGSVKKVVATVGNVYPGLCNLFPEAAECADKDWLAYLWIALAFILAFILFIIVFWMGNYLNLPRPLVLLIAIAAAIIMIVALILAGWFDAALSVYPNSGRRIP